MWKNIFRDISWKTFQLITFAVSVGLMAFVVFNVMSLKTPTPKPSTNSIP